MLNKDLGKINISTMPIEEIAEGNALDASYTLDLYELLEQSIPSSFVDFYERVVKPLTVYLALQSYLGIPIREKELGDLEVELDKLKQEALEEVYKHPYLDKDKHNIKSNKSLASILYCSPEITVVEGSFNVYWPDTTKGGDPSTNADSLKFILKHVTEELQKRGING